MSNKSKRIVRLPFEEAVALAVKENLERDERLGLLEGGVTDEDKHIYEEEARYLLQSTKENYLPEFADHHNIYVAN